ncbi:16S rRNA (cytosine(1402)-N(4))-methyltransferase [Candidatus Microgenomates bacterium]|nr:16S rRNA (cytosine(1402)-N(4))-methyltransferase [Candidatus Microgenomates bacterium]
MGDFLLAGRFFKTGQKTHPATKAFMALRIAVNTELDTLEEGLINALDTLKPGGRLVIISFHSGEDRIVKNNFKMWELDNRLKILTKKPIKPSNEEIKLNPRARSANLRVIQKI